MFVITEAETEAYESALEKEEQPWDTPTSTYNQIFSTTKFTK